MTIIDISGAPWRTSSHSGNEGQCVEVAPVTGAVGVRDSKDRAHGHLAVTRATWTAFTRATTRDALH